MSGQQTYIVRLLRELEGSFGGPGNEVARGVLGRITQRVSGAENIRDALEAMYAIEGYDEFALRLLWCAERKGISPPSLNGPFLTYEVNQLAAAFMRAMNGRWREAATVMAPSVSKPLEKFYETLHRFGRTIEQCKRKAGEGENFKGIEVEGMYRILNECSLLEEAGAAAGNQDVVRFASACAEYVQYILDHDLLRDIRSLNIIDNANLTLQTSLEAVGGEDFDSLRQMIALLENPEGLLK